MEMQEAEEYVTNAARMVLQSDGDQWHYWQGRAVEALMYAETAQSVVEFGIPRKRVASWHLAYEMQNVYAELINPFNDPVSTDWIQAYARQVIGGSMNGALYLYGDLLNASFALVDWNALADILVGELDPVIGFAATKVIDPGTILNEIGYVNMFKEEVSRTERGFMRGVIHGVLSDLDREKTDVRDFAGEVVRRIKQYLIDPSAVTEMLVQVFGERKGE